MRHRNDASECCIYSIEVFILYLLRLNTAPSARKALQVLGTPNQSLDALFNTMDGSDEVNSYFVAVRSFMTFWACVVRAAMRANELFYLYFYLIIFFCSPPSTLLTNKTGWTWLISLTFLCLSLSLYQTFYTNAKLSLDTKCCGANYTVWLLASQDMQLDYLLSDEILFRWQALKCFLAWTFHVTCY